MSAFTTASWQQWTRKKDPPRPSQGIFSRLGSVMKSGDAHQGSISGLPTADGRARNNETQQETQQRYWQESWVFMISAASSIVGCLFLFEIGTGLHDP